MRLTTSSSTLSARLLALSKVFNSKNTMPILDCFLFEVSNKELTVTASDSENVMTAVIPLDEMDGEGTFAVNNRTIIDAVKELPEQPLTMEVDMNTYAIKVIYQNGIYNFTAQSGEEFPRLLPLEDNTASILVDAKTLVNDISRSVFAIANDELRPVMNGIYFDASHECLTVVASDGHKLVRNRLFSIKTDQPAAFIFPKKPASLLKGMLLKDDSEVVMRFDDRNAIVLFNNSTLNCRLIEGRYPNYNSVIPQNNTNEAIVDREGLLAAIKRVQPFSNDASNLIRFHIEGGIMQLDAEDFDFNKTATERISCEYNGRPMSIGFKGSVFVEVLSNFDSQEVNIQLADPSRAGLVVPTEQPEDQDVLMLMMPMLIND